MQPANSNLHERSQRQRQRETRLTKSVSFIVGVYLMFNLPVLFVTLYNKILERDIKTYNHYSWTNCPLVILELYMLTLNNLVIQHE